MKIFVLIKPNAKAEKVEKVGNSHFKALVKASPVDGKANLALIKALANYFKIAPARVAIISGCSSKNKIIEIK